MISNIQFLRAFAALAVVFFHTKFLLWGGLHTDFQGVAIFFVISGFIIPRVSQQGSLEFVRHRIIRIIPIYWLATLFFLFPVGLKELTIILMVLLPFISPYCQHHLKQATRYFAYRSTKPRWILLVIVIYSMIQMNPKLGLGNFLDSLFFIPEMSSGNKIGFPILAVGWTLNIEMFFYSIFALALVFSRKLAPAITALVLILIKYLLVSETCTGTLCFWYGHEYTTYFIFGIGLYYLFEVAEKFKDRISLSSAFLLAVPAAASYLVINLLPQDILTNRLVGYLAPPLLVFAALTCHLAGVQIKWKPVILMGDASYSIYLFHLSAFTIFSSIARHVPVPDMDTLPGMLILLAMSTWIAILVHQKLELPLLRTLRRSVNPPSLLATSLPN